MSLTVHLAFSFSRFHCCGRDGHSLWPSWYRPIMTEVSLCMFMDSGRLSRWRSSTLPVSTVSYTGRTQRVIRRQLYVPVCQGRDPSVAASTSPGWPAAVLPRQPCRRPRLPGRQAAPGHGRTVPLEGRARPAVGGKLRRDNGDPATGGVLPAVSGVLSPGPATRPPALQLDSVRRRRDRPVYGSPSTIPARRLHTGHRHAGNHHQGQFAMLCVNTLMISSFWSLNIPT